MSGDKIELTGWKAIVVIVVLIGFFGIRFVTLGDKKDDKVLMKELEILLVSDYFPNEVEKLKAAYDSGDEDRLNDVAKSVTTAKLNIESVQASSPILNFSTTKEVVVKVTYSLNDASGTRDRKTKYYLFNHRSIGNTWRYQHDTSAVRYYLNFK